MKPPPWFEAAIRAYDTDPAGILRESNRTKSERSLQNVADRFGAQAMDVFFALTQLPAAGLLPPCLPTPAELRTELEPLLDVFRERYPFLTTNLSVSIPAASRLAVSINVILRLHDRRGQQAVKVKIGSFVDAATDRFWEVGFVTTDKSIRRSLPRLLQALDSDPGDYFVLSRLVDCTKRFIRRRETVKGLDLTPAFYHVAPLCLRAGGVPRDRDRLREHLDEIDRAFARHLTTAADGSCPASRHRRWVVSWLLDRGRLRDHAGNVITWNPPRFIWSVPRRPSIMPSMVPNVNS